MLCIFDATVIRIGHALGRAFTGKDNHEGDKREMVKVLEEIKKQSGYNFVYNEKFVKDLGGITVDVKEVSLDSVMKEVLEGTGLRYRIQDRIILLERAPQESSGQKFKVIRGNVKDEEGAPYPVSR